MGDHLGLLYGLKLQYVPIFPLTTCCHRPKSKAQKKHSQESLKVPILQMVRPREIEPPHPAPEANAKVPGVSLTILKRS